MRYANKLQEIASSSPDGTVFIKVDHLKPIFFYLLPGLFFADLTHLREVISTKLVDSATDVRMDNEPFIVSDNYHTMFIFLL